METTTFKIQKTLNSKLWDENSELDSEARGALLKIAGKFISKIDIPKSSVKDIVLTGSLANFNWSSYSDVDVHIIVVFANIEGEKKFIKNLLDDEKKLWNLEHHIEIKGFPVEMYVQDSSETLVASGVFSLLQNKWVKTPTRKNVVIDMKMIRKKSAIFKNQIDLLEKNPDSERAKQIKAKLGQFRQCGLDEEGEFSTENLVFKLLRRDGYLEKLTSIRLEAFDDEMSLE